MALTGDRLVALATTADRQDATGTTTSTAFTATLTGGTSCGLAFVAPASGSVLIHNTMNGFNGGGASFGAFEVRAGGTVGSGAVFQAAVDTKAIVLGAASLAMTYTTLVTGLTPGSIYNVRQMFRVSAGTGTYAWKELCVGPCL